ncbi:hypothetical protein [Streptomyces sp. cg2]|uniref:hypothetical protein n=1 Tax=Streptomyces sp. cg2 TaxID=3238799 RepID=UPI0034E2560B
MRPTRASIPAVATGALLALLLPTGQAGAATPRPDRPAPTAATSLGTFWTAARMRSATPAT